MGTIFDINIYSGYIVKGDLIGAIKYVKDCPEQIDVYTKYVNIFENEQPVNYEVSSVLNEILGIYQQYYREVFFLRLEKEEAENNLRKRLATQFANKTASLDSLEENEILNAFRDEGLNFMGGKTGGYYGPYIWKSTEHITYEVELPDGIQSYPVIFLDDFIMLSWMDYLSFGKVTPGGWTTDDGIINCVKKSYNTESENFRVSLLKHEAQHVRDLEMYKNISSEDLEYRAKLVELIYSSKRNLLEKFIHEAGDAHGHSVAAKRIINEFRQRTNLDVDLLVELDVAQIQSIAQLLFTENTVEIGDV